MCRMASEQPQVSIDLSPFCLGGMTTKPSIGGACHYATCTYDSGTIQLAPDLVDAPRSTGWGFMDIRVRNGRVFFWSYMSVIYFCRGLSCSLCLLGDIYRKVSAWHWLSVLSRWSELRKSHVKNFNIISNITPQEAFNEIISSRDWRILCFLHYSRN